MRLFALIGHPLQHSFSARYFNDKFDREGIDAMYRNFDIEDAAELYNLVADNPNLCGLNVTSPHKTAVMPMLQSLTDSARAIGAVNTIRVERDTKGVPMLIGHNTDSPAFARTLAPHLRPEDHTCLLLGATGGASKALMYALDSLGIKAIRVSRRNIDGCMAYDQIDASIMQRCTIIINATPLGMHPHISECAPIPYDMITDRHVCYDLIYNPEETEFLRRARTAGAKTINGLQMLYSQADLAWQFWNGDV